jgi:outer membrane protein TolC
MMSGTSIYGVDTIPPFDKDLLFADAQQEEGDIEGVHPSQVASLAQLEERVDGSVVIRAEVARLDELIAELEHQRVVSGWRIIGHVRGGYVDEQLTSEQRRVYYPSQASAGLTYPLFGKWQDEQIKLLEMEAGTKNEELRIEIRHLEALESLRRAYILMWSAQLKVDLANSFLKQRKHYLDLLGERMTTGHLLKSDYLEFVSAIDLVEREREVNLGTAERSRDLIEALTGIPLELSFLSPPALPVSCELMEQAVAALADNPEILLYQNNVEIALDSLERRKYSDIKGNVTLRGMAGSSEFVYSDYGYGGMVSLDFSMPSDPFKAESASRRVSKQRLRRMQYELEAKTKELKLTVKERFRIRNNEHINVRFGTTRLQAGAELLREKKIRVDRIDGDVLEQLQKARYNYYRVAVDYIEAEARLLNSAAGMLRYCPENRNEAVAAKDSRTIIEPLNEPVRVVNQYSEQVGEPDGPLENQAGLAVYLWQSQLYIDGSNSVEIFKQQNIRKILISLNAEQLESLKSETAQLQFEQFLDSCRIAGITPGVLLGEPTWILPGYRQDLLKILQFLNDFSFEQVHLDIEPYQLNVEAYGIVYLSAQLLRTLQMAKEVSDHPIEISIHPRLLNTEEIGWCFGCGLSNLDLERVVVMIYKTDVHEVRKKMSAFASQYPDLELAVAQSVETILGPKNSYAQYGLARFMDLLPNLMGGVGGDDWKGDVYIQDWASLIKMLKNNASPKNKTRQ